MTSSARLTLAILLAALPVRALADPAGTPEAAYPPPPPPAPELLPPPPPPPALQPAPLTAPPPPPLAVPPPAPPAPKEGFVVHEARGPARHGLAMKIGALVPFHSETDHSARALASAGMRFALLPRERGWGFNLALALLMGGELTPDTGDGAFSTELRVEGLFAGKTTMLLPVMRIYGVAGVRAVNSRTGRDGAAGHFGAGIGFDVLPLLDDVGGAGNVTGSGGLLALFILSPTAEILYLVQPDGSRVPAFVLAFGM